MMELLGRRELLGHREAMEPMVQQVLLAMTALTGQLEQRGQLAIMELTERPVQRALQVMMVTMQSNCRTVSIPGLFVLLTSISGDVLLGVLTRIPPQGDRIMAWIAVWIRFCHPHPVAVPTRTDLPSPPLLPKASATAGKAEQAACAETIAGLLAAGSEPDAVSTPMGSSLGPPPAQGWLLSLLGQAMSGTTLEMSRSWSVAAM